MRRGGGIIGAGAVIALAACAPVDAPAAGSTAAMPATLFVAGKRGNTLSKVDLASGEEVLRVPSCTNPHELATSPDGRHVALACYGGTTVDVFRTRDLVKVASHDLGENARPHGIVWHSDGSLYVTAEGQQAVHVLMSLEDSPEHVTLVYSTGKQGSHMLAVSPDGSVVWTTDLGSRTVTRIPLNSDAGPSVSVAVGEEPEGIALSPDGQTLWVSARGSNQAFALDPVTMQVRQTVSTGRFPLRIAVRPQGDVAITSDLQDGSLSVIDTGTAKVIRTIAVSTPEEAQTRFQVTILWSDDGSKIFVAETASDTVAEVDYASGTVLRRLKVGEGGDGMAILP
ncbi:MAG: YncE family protein [Porphyrobacter sp. IPPAS B-1204]|nr:MAG: YncE family protein [Porphyrobacter sp. IPPAS B-1204]